MILATLNNLLAAAVSAAAVLADSMLHWIGQALLFGTALALLTALLLRLLGRRLSPGWQGALWMLVLAKFLLPVGPGWQYSIAHVAGNGARWIVHRFVPETSPAANTAPAPAGEYWVTLDQPPKSVAAAPVSSLRPALLVLIAALYGVGVSIAATVRLARYRRFAAACRRLPPAPPHIASLVHRLCRRLGLRRMPEVRLDESTRAPFVLGLRRPQLVLSPRQMFSLDELEAVVLHEVAHLRRGDLWIRCLQWLAGTVLFFWPVVAWVNRRIDLAREHACDAWALRHGRLSTVEYARCLLGALQPGKGAPAGYAPAAMAASVEMVERRIEMILEDSLRSFRSGWRAAPAAALLVLWSGFALAGAAPVSEPAKPEKAADKDEVQTVIIRADAEDTDGATQDIIMHAEVAGEPGAMKVFSAGNGGEGPVMVRIDKEDPTLQEFLVAHPTADADGDGKLSPPERDGYYVARVLRDPAATLKQFPKADRNADGSLDAGEAVRLIQGDMIRTHIMQAGNGDIGGLKRKMIAIHGGPEGVQVAGGMNVEVNMEHGDAEPQVSITGPDGNPVDGNVQLFVKKVGDGDADDGFSWVTNESEGGSACDWLLTQGGEPAVADVRRGVETIHDNADQMLRKIHPDIDADGDGRVSADERKAFHARQESHMHARMLERHPDADLNGDGVLTSDEARDFFKAKAGANGKVVWIENAHEGGTVEKETFEIKVAPAAKQ